MIQDLDEFHPLWTGGHIDNVLLSPTLNQAEPDMRLNEGSRVAQSNWLHGIHALFSAVLRTCESAGEVTAHVSPSEQCQFPESDALGLTISRNDL